MATTKEVDAAMKADVNYWGVQSNAVHAIRRTLFSEAKSFFEALKKWKKNPEKFTGHPQFPKYSSTTEKRIIEIYQIPKVDKDGYWLIPMNVEFRKRFGSIKIRMPQAVSLLFKKVKQLNIETIVVGYNAGWKLESNMGKKNNQQFVQIPFHKLISSIENKCLKEGIRFKKQEESYTSKASFLDRDTIPVWSKDDKTNYSFSGKRIHRGQYQNKTGPCIHGDINGALNILRKSEVVELDENLKVKTPNSNQIGSTKT